MKITVVSPSNRPEGLRVVDQSLIKQTFKDFEWLICSPYDPAGFLTTWKRFQEPAKKEGDFYNLNKAWNVLFNAAQGELIVSIVDYTEFPTDTLERLWEWYIKNPVTCVSGVGIQYKDNKKVWTDPRIEGRSVHPIHPQDMEFRIASMPRRAIQAVGGMDEEYDKAAAVSEKEICLRMGSLGYVFFVDETIAYKFYQHEPHGKEWDKKYKEAIKLVNHHYNEMVAGRRLYLNYVSR